MVLNYAQFARKLGLGLSTKLSDIMVTGRSEFQPFFSPMTLLADAPRVQSSKLKEQNIIIRRDRATGKPASAQPTPAASDDEGSIVKQPRSNVLCASCKTRESVQWWKAPKGLSSSILCDDCGLNWRKYADFTKPVVREGSLPVKGKAVEKREGTPLNGPTAKRAKVS